MPTQTRVKPQRVAFEPLTRDNLVLKLGLSGRSTKCIMRKTGFSACQVTYRLHAGQVRRKDYRDGDVPIMDEIMDRHDNELEKALLVHLDQVDKANKYHIGKRSRQE